MMNTEQFIKATGITLPNIKEYLRFGYLIPAYRSKGKRDRNRFSIANAIEARIIKNLSENGIHRAWIKPISDALRISETGIIERPVITLIVSENISLQLRLISTQNKVNSKLKEMGLL